MEVRECVRFTYRNPVSKHMLYTWCTPCSATYSHIRCPLNFSLGRILLNIELSYSFPRTHGGQSYYITSVYYGM